MYIVIENTFECFYITLVPDKAQFRGFLRDARPNLLLRWRAFPGACPACYWGFPQPGRLFAQLRPTLRPWPISRVPCQENCTADTPDEGPGPSPVLPWKG